MEENTVVKKEISLKLKERFCKDNRLSIKVFQEPYFSNRLQMVEGAYEKYLDFVEMIYKTKEEGGFDGNEQDYFTEYNRVKDVAINYIKESYVYKELNSADMNKFASKVQLRQTDAYKDCNIGKDFLSIDLVKANFSSLVIYGRDELGLTYEDSRSFHNSLDYNSFLSKFTDNRHIIESKYIRQVILGNCNPKRQVTYEKYLMNKLMKHLLVIGVIKYGNIYSLCSDEIILSLDGFTKESRENLVLKINEYSSSNQVPLRVECFKVGKICGTDAYIRKNIDTEEVSVKCVNPVEAPFVYRVLHGQEIQEEDYVFNFDGKLAKLLEPVKVEIKYN